MAQNILGDPEFQRYLNRWMLGTHIQWGLILAVFFIGINYTVIWVTDTFHVPSWEIALVLVPCGTLGMIWQALYYRIKKKPSEESTRS